LFQRNVVQTLMTPGNMQTRVILSVKKSNMSNRCLSAH